MYATDDNTGAVGVTGVERQKQYSRVGKMPSSDKRKRLRINHCLDHLKTLLPALTQEETAGDRTLELTVEHLKKMKQKRRQLKAAMSAPNEQQFSQGYTRCIGDISHLLHTTTPMDEGVRLKIEEHLANKAVPAHPLFAKFQGAQNPGRFDVYPDPSTKSTAPPMQLPLWRPWS